MITRDKIKQIRQFRKDAKRGDIVQLPKSFLKNLMAALEENIMDIPEKKRSCKNCCLCENRAERTVKSARKVLKEYI